MPNRAAVWDRLRNVYWIGGGSGAGKSTVARRLAVEHGLRLYSTDDAMADHGSRASPELSPFMMRFVAMDMDERWVNRSPKAMLDTFHWFQGEGFGLIVEDLLGFPEETRVMAEGFRLLPHLVRPLLAERRRAVWLLPTPDFRQAAFERRQPAGMPWTFIDQTSDPDGALRNLLERDRLFTDRLAEDTLRLGLHVIEVGAAMTEDELAERVTAALGL